MARQSPLRDATRRAALGGQSEYGFERARKGRAEHPTTDPGCVDPPHLPIRSSPLSSPLGRSGWNARATPRMVFLEKLRGSKRTETPFWPFAKVDVEGSNPFSRSTDSAQLRAGRRTQASPKQLAKWCESGVKPERQKWCEDRRGQFVGPGTSLPRGRPREHRLRQDPQALDIFGLASIRSSARRARSSAS
jgi:hypothetical protein